MGWVPVAAAIFQGVQAIKGFSDAKAAEKATKRANAAMMRQAEEENRLLMEDASKRALAERQDAARVRSQQIALYLKSGVTLDGSPFLVGEDTTEQGGKNASNLMETASSQTRSNLLRAEAGQLPVTRADFFGTAADVLGAGNKAKTAGKQAGYWN